MNTNNIYYQGLLKGSKDDVKGSKPCRAALEYFRWKTTPVLSNTTILPSYKELATKFGVTTYSIKRALNKLVQKKLISVEVNHETGKILCHFTEKTISLGEERMKLLKESDKKHREMVREMEKYENI